MRRDINNAISFVCVYVCVCVMLSSEDLLLITQNSPYAKRYSPQTNTHHSRYVGPYMYACVFRMRVSPRTDEANNSSSGLRQSQSHTLMRQTHTRTLGYKVYSLAHVMVAYTECVSHYTRVSVLSSCCSLLRPHPFVVVVVVGLMMTMSDETVRPSVRSDPIHSDPVVHRAQTSPTTNTQTLSTHETTTRIASSRTCDDDAIKLHAARCATTLSCVRAFECAWVVAKTATWAWTLFLDESRLMRSRRRERTTCQTLRITLRTTADVLNDGHFLYSGNWRCSKYGNCIVFNVEFGRLMFKSNK